MAIPGLIPIFHEFKASFPFVFEVEKPNPPSANNRTTSLFKKKLNPEKPDVPLNKNDAFQKVQKRRVQEKR